MIQTLQSNRNLWLLLAIFLLSVPVKLVAAQHLIWDIDFVPVLSRGQAFFDGGPFPAYGTLSSVAAYNMPFLVWLQMPAMLLTNHVPTILILTQTAFNLIGTVYIYKTGAALFNDRVGLAAAALFTFSEAGITSAYTAWAQLLLPTFFILVAYGLFQWRLTGRGRYAAMAIIVTTAAFMTHFAAILLYPIIVMFWLLMRPPLDWRGLIAGVVGALLLLSPYMIFEAGRDFADLRAFLSKQPLVPQEIIDSYSYLKPGAITPTENTGPPPADSPSQEEPAAESIPQPEPAESPSRVQRGINWLLSLPVDTVAGLALAFDVPLNTLADEAPALFWLNEGLRLIWMALFFGGVIVALFQVMRAIRARWGADGWRGRYQSLTAILAETAAGRMTMLLLFLLAITGGLLITRSTPAGQGSYYIGLVSIQWVMVAYSGVWLMTRLRTSSRIVLLTLSVLVVAFAALSSLDRVWRVLSRDTASYSPFNVWLYQPIDAAVAWIAADWDSESPLTVRYDIMPENANLWWVAPWNHSDPSYRIGMSYDILLATYYGLENTNTDPIGAADSPDYIVTYAPGLARYDLERYQVERFDAIYVLKGPE